MSETAGPRTDHSIHVVAVIGAGQAGRTFAMMCAGAGFYVVLEDVMPSNLRKAEVEYSDLSLRGGYGELELASNVEGAVREIKYSYIAPAVGNRVFILRAVVVLES